MNPLSERYDETIDTMATLLNVTEDSELAKCKFYLMNAANIIKDIRQKPFVEDKYVPIQIQMAIELYNKQGIEGQTGHTENSISRTFEASSISPSLLAQVVPRAKVISEDLSSIPMPLRERVL